MKEFLLAATALFGFAGFVTDAAAEQGSTGATASFHGTTLGKDWGSAVSAISRATNSGMADGDESTVVTHPVGGLPFQMEVSDPGVGNAVGASNHGKEE